MMDVCYVLVVISVILNVNCEKHEEDKNMKNMHEQQCPCPPPHHRTPPTDLLVPTYAICLIVFSMSIMLLVIIYLAVTLARMKRNIYINNDQRRFFRERPDWRGGDNVDLREKYRNNESTLTVNSGVIEVNRYSEPETPTRPENEIKIYVTKPPGTVPILHKKQMEELIQHVLNRSKKSVSTSLRELNEIQNEVKIKPMIQASGELTKEVNDVQNNGHDVKSDESNNTEKTKIDGQNNNKTNEQIKTENNEHSKEETIKKEEEKEVKTEEEVNGPESVLEIEVYDTVPTPKRTTQGSDDVDNIYDCPPSDRPPRYDCLPSDSMPVYDCPPTDNNPVYACLPDQSNDMLLMDVDTEYLMPLTRRDTNTYINARTSRK